MKVAMRSPFLVLMRRRPSTIPPTVTSRSRQLRPACPVVAVAHLRQLGLEALERVAGDEEAERLLLVGQPLALPASRRGRAAAPAPRPAPRPAAAEQPEQAGLALLAVALLLLPDLHRPVEGGQERGPPPVEAVEAAALDEALHHAPVHRPQVDPLAEVEERPEGPAAPPRRSTASTAPSPTFLIAASPKRMRVARLSRRHRP